MEVYGWCRYLGVGDYSSWNEDERIAWLVQELESKRPLVPPSMPMTSEVKEVGSLVPLQPATLSKFLSFAYVCLLNHQTNCRSAGFSCVECGLQVIDTLKVAAEVGPESVSAYVISMATHASDVLAVELLKREAWLMVGTDTILLHFLLPHVRIIAPLRQLM